MSELINTLHTNLVFNRRTRILADQFAWILPSCASVLDVGCGDGTIDALIAARRPDVSFRGVDVLLRRETRIPVELFDGTHLPAVNKSYDAVTFIDVLHHTTDPTILLAEAKRVARKLIVLKDHTRDGWLAHSRLRFMDWVGNAHHNVVLPYNYWSERQWRDAFQALGLKVGTWKADIGLYPFPASLVFGYGLHCIVALRPS
jgi:SAM-dependent methyltransferase